VIAPSKFLLCVLLLTLNSCATSGSKQLAYLPPKVDCAQFDPPAKRLPALPSPAEKSLVAWMLYSYAAGDYAESLLEQRIATAACMQEARKRGDIR